MNVIIIAAISLLVLVILSVLVLRGGNILSSSNACTSVSGAYCDGYDDDAERMGCDPDYSPDRTKTCPGNEEGDDRDEICCIPV
jgi:hypothetical protein